MSNNSDSVILYVIKDWAGNLMLEFKNYGVFAHSEEAFDYLLQRFPNDDDFDEYQVLELTNADAMSIDRHMHLDRIDRDCANDEKRIFNL